MTQWTRYVHPHKFAELTGYDPEQVKAHIAAGVWRQGHEYRIAPDGHTLIDMAGYERWATGRE